MNAPCYKCNKRILNCHSNCNEYHLYKVKLDEIHKQQDIDKNYIDYKMNAIRNFNKKNNKYKRSI